MILWNNKEFIEDEFINSLVEELKTKPDCYNFEANYYSSYFTHPNERPEIKLNNFYNSIIQKASKDLSLYNRMQYVNEYWMQLYTKNGGVIDKHHHYSPNNIFSWVHFVKPTKEKCFYFLTPNKKIYPNQEEGEFIIFPSFALHAVDVNMCDEDRVIMAGNVIVNNII